MPDLLTCERSGLEPDAIAALTAMGHTIRERTAAEGGFQGDGETIMIDPKTRLRLGAADLRKPDAMAVGLLILRRSPAIQGKESRR